MKRRVYIETTIASFYHETRTDPAVAVRREWTRRWWDRKSQSYECVTSEAVIAELERGEFPHQAEALEFARALPRLDLVEEIDEIVTTYLQHRLMPGDPGGDAMHLALASFYKCDFLMTWNCHHLANANKFTHVARINAIMGLFVPALVTPLELLGEEN